VLLNLRQCVSNKAQPSASLSSDDVLEGMHIRIGEVPDVETFSRLNRAVIGVDMQKEAVVDSIVFWVID
jgi:hypothetical protein